MRDNCSLSLFVVLVLSAIVGTTKDVKARNFHVNLSQFRVWAAGSTAPHQGMATEGSSSAARRNERSASARLKAQASAKP